MAKQAPWRYKVDKYIFLPIYILIMTVLVITGISLAIDGLFMSSSVSQTKEDDAFMILILFSIVSVFAVLPSMGQAINQSIDHPTKPDMLPLLCTCGKNTKRVYAIPRLRYLGPFTFVGVALTSLLSYAIYPHLDIFVLLGIILAAAVLIFILSYLEFIVRRHTVTCATKRGVMNTCYFPYAGFASQVADTYRDRKSGVGQNDPSWLQAAQLLLMLTLITLSIFASSRL